MNPFNVKKSIVSRTKTSAMKSMVNDTPWLCDNIFGGESKLIFKSNGELIFSKGGDAEIGSWSFMADANSFLLTIGNDSLLLNALFVDSNLMILRKDGSRDQLLLFRNANTFIFDSIAQYFTRQYGESDGFRVIPLLNNYLLNITGGKKYLSELIDQSAFVSDPEYDSIQECGTFISADKKTSITINKGIIQRIAILALVNFKGLGQVEIEKNSMDYDSTFSSRLTHDGKKVPDGIYYDNSDRRYSIVEGEIQRMDYQTSQTLASGAKIKFLQSDKHRLSPGDKVIGSYFPDGKYRLKGKLKTFRIKDDKIV